jgi:probable phosphoglycerate mutase
MSELNNDPFLMNRENAAELLLIRHGDAIPDADEIIPSGIYDNLPLSHKGRKQAIALAERLKNTHFDAAYSSPLRRCQETAAPLMKLQALSPILVEELKEITLGDVISIPRVKEGDDLTVLSEALHARQAAIIRAVAGMGNWDAIPYSEPSKAFRQRVVTAIDAIANNHIGQRVLIFAHGGVINAYAAEIFAMDKEFFFPCANTSITLIRVNGKKRVLYTLNDIAHLLS